MAMLGPLLTKLAASNNDQARREEAPSGLGGAGSRTRLSLYLNINNVQADEHAAGVAAAFDAHKSAILPVLIRGEGANECARSANIILVCVTFVKSARFVEQVWVMIARKR